MAEQNVMEILMKNGARITYKPIREVALPEKAEFVKWLAPGIAEFKKTRFLSSDQTGVFSVARGVMAEPVYKSAEITPSGLIHVIGKRHKLMTRDGIDLAGQECDEARDLGEGCYAVKFKKRWRIYRVEDQQPITQEEYTAVSNFSEGSCAVTTKEGGAWLIGTDGLPILTTTWERANPFVNGFARVGTKKNTQYIDREGTVIFSAQTKSARDFFNGYAVFENPRGRFGVINEQGEVVIEPKYSFIKDCGSEMFVVSNNGTLQPDGRTFSGRDYGLIRPDGREVLPLSYDQILEDGNGGYVYGHVSRWEVRDGNTIRYYGVFVRGQVDKEGNVVLPDRFVGIGQESEGLVAFKTYDGNRCRFGYMTPDGKKTFEVADVDYGSDPDPDRKLLRDDINNQMQPFRNGTARIRVRNEKQEGGPNLFRKATWVGAKLVDWYSINKDGKPVECADDREPDVFSCEELPFLDAFRALSPQMQEEVRGQVYSFDDMYEVNYCSGTFAILDGNMHLMCGNRGPYTALPGLAPDNRYLFVTKQAENVWITLSGQSLATHISEFESPVNFSSGLAAYETLNERKKPVWGYMDYHGKILVEPKYSIAQRFNDGYAAVCDRTGWKILCREYTAQAIEPAPAAAENPEPEA